MVYEQGKRLGFVEGADNRALAVSSLSGPLGSEIPYSFKDSSRISQLKQKFNERKNIYDGFFLHLVLLMAFLFQSSISRSFLS